MASKVFVDANFLLDITLQRKNAEEANAIVQLSIHKEIDLFTTPSVLHIVCYFISKELKFSSVEIKKIVLVLLNDVRIIDCDHPTTLTAVNSKIEDIEDALQYYAALSHDIEYFISNDKHLKEVSLPQLPVYTSKEFLKEFS